MITNFNARKNIKVVTLCGGVPLRGQLATLEHGAHIVVGTPGRVMDHLARASLKLDALNTLVLDDSGDDDGPGVGRPGHRHRSSGFRADGAQGERTAAAVAGAVERLPVAGG